VASFPRTEREAFSDRTIRPRLRRRGTWTETQVRSGFIRLRPIRWRQRRCRWCRRGQHLGRSDEVRSEVRSKVLVDVSLGLAPCAQGSRHLEHDQSTEDLRSRHPRRTGGGRWVQGSRASSRGDSEEAGADPFDSSVAQSRSGRRQRTTAELGRGSRGRGQRRCFPSDHPPVNVSATDCATQPTLLTPARGAARHLMLYARSYGLPRVGWRAHLQARGLSMPALRCFWLS
jgi:hypothetical protein